MNRILASAAAACTMALTAPGLAHADNLSDQANICRTAMTGLVSASMDDASFKFKSSGGGVKKKRLQFTMRHDGNWGVAKCIIVGDEIQEVQWPRQFRDTLGASISGEVLQASLASPTAAAEPANSPS